jgi:ribosome-associated protein
MKTIKINDSELVFTFIRTPGPGGQNVNKVSSGVLLRFNVVNSTSLPEGVRQRLCTLLGKKLTLSGDCIIKACRFRTQNRNRQDALDRLDALIQQAQKVPKKRKKTKPTLASRMRRLDSKKKQSQKKANRREKGV